MIEQYIYDRITGNAALQALLTDGDGGYFLFPAVVPRSIDIEKAVTFTLITSQDAYPNVGVVSYQFSIFAKTHTDTVAIAKALKDLFHQDVNTSAGSINVVGSMRTAEGDLGQNFDDGLFQRQATYLFNIR